MVDRRGHERGMPRGPRRGADPTNPYPMRDGGGQGGLAKAASREQSVFGVEGHAGEITDDWFGLPDDVLALGVRGEAKRCLFFLHLIQLRPS